MDFRIGERWVSDPEPQLGLGIVAEVDARLVTVSFPASGERRRYAAASAPLTRIVFKVGDVITTHDGISHTVVDVTEEEGLLSYVVDDPEVEEVSELEISSATQFSSPEQRLVTGQLDKLADHQLRLATLDHAHRLARTPIDGLLGSRTDLLPHQVHIAAEVSARHAPRVLLADEVGLGKTIEAGMILHALLHRQQAERVLVVVPETLTHQWLVEMLRRFNLRFALFNAERLAALAEAGEESPFETEQLILISLEQLIEPAPTADPANGSSTLDSALAAPWEVVVVDEAHHLAWSPGNPSEAYRAIEALAERSIGLLLLTATPEQAGIESHFARLRLLDPARFSDLEAFRRDEARYGALNDLVAELQQSGNVPALHKPLAGFLECDASTVASLDADQIIGRLLLRHGTGRVLFRNSRAAVAGFTARQAHLLPLPTDKADGSGMAHQDPRIAWLVEFLRDAPDRKVLVITAKAEDAIALDRHLKAREGFRSAAFHEGLSLIERDRAAAYFADDDPGAQVLVCSEIGSEGRNFQFAHHLVLLDLPENPDLLEQRIGRLDRIGQRHDVQLYLPVVAGSAQDKLARWYHEGAELLERPTAAGLNIFEAFADRLRNHFREDDAAGFDQLLADTRAFSEELREELRKGRDRLLELNSCDHDRATETITQILQEEAAGDLATYMALAFDRYGVEQESHSERTLVIRPGDHLRTGYFPGLIEDGVTLTFDRRRALAREDIEFLSWEHPMVVDTMDMIRSSDIGNATLGRIALRTLPAGALLLEAVFVVSSMAPRSLQLGRYLPPTPIRVLVDADDKDWTDQFPQAQLDKLCQPVDRATAQAAIKQVQTELERMIGRCRSLVDAQLSGLVEVAAEQCRAAYFAEHARLVELREINPSIRNDEIESLRSHWETSEAAIAAATLRLEALRLAVNIR